MVPGNLNNCVLGRNKMWGILKSDDIFQRHVRIRNPKNKHE